MEFWQSLFLFFGEQKHRLRKRVKDCWRGMVKNHLKKWRVLYLFLIFSTGILAGAAEALYFPYLGVIFRQDQHHSYEYFLAFVGLADMIALGYYWKKDIGGNFDI